MDFPKILNAGVYCHAQKSSQTCNAIHLGLSVKGPIRTGAGTGCGGPEARIQCPDGEGCERTDPDAVP